MAFLTENWAGNFPTWLSPIQVQLITISEKHNDYAMQVEKQLKNLGIRVKTDYSDHTIGKKIRMHRKMRPAYMAIVGDDEIKNNSISIRARNGNQKNDIELNIFLDKIKSEIESRSKTLELA